MGTWGTGLYSNDTACDVREDYKALLGEGIPEPEATRRLLEQWKSELSDPDDAPVFWLALADVQWNLGRLQEQVKREALAVIESGADLARWLPDKKLAGKRKTVLQRLHKKLNTAQPSEKKVKKRFVASTDWNLGDVYSFQLQSGMLAWLHVIGFHQDKGGRGPVCEILDWAGENTPDKKTLERAGYRRANKPYQNITQFLLGSLSERDFQRDRVHLVAKEVKPKQKCGGYAVILWRSIDKQFEQIFGLQ